MTSALATYLAALTVLSAGCASVARPDGWHPVPLSPPFDGTSTVTTGTDVRNRVLDLDALPFVGHWIRLVADVDDSGALGLAVSSNTGSMHKVRVPLTLCDHKTGPARCWSTRYVLPGTNTIHLVVFPNQRNGTASAIHFEAYDGPLVDQDSDGPFATRIAEMIATLQEHYYRSREVDWSTVEARVAPFRRAPSGIDPMPAAFMAIRHLLPGHEHTGMYPTVRVGTGAAENPAHPTCRDLGDGVHQLVLPGTVALAVEQCEDYI